MLKREIEDTLHNYAYMVKEIERLTDLLGDAGEGVVRKYESMDMPKAKGGKSDPVGLEASRRERHYKRLKELQRKVQYVEEHIGQVDGEKEKIVLACLMDGLNIQDISQHMGISRGHVYRIRNNIIDGMQKTPA